MNTTKTNDGASLRRRGAWLLLIAVVSLTMATWAGAQDRAQQKGGVNLRQVAPAPNVVVRQGDLDRWMYSRALWVSAFSALCGFLLSWFYLSGLSYGSGLETEHKARRIFFVFLFFIMLPAVLLLLYADMYFYWFSGYLAFPLLWALFGLQGLLMTGAALLAFTGAAALVSRFRAGSRCPYMLWLRPKVG